MGKLDEYGERERDLIKSVMTAIVSAQVAQGIAGESKEELTPFFDAALEIAKEVEEYLRERLDKIPGFDGMDRDRIKCMAVEMLNSAILDEKCAVTRDAILAEVKETCSIGMQVAGAVNEFLCG
jgi:hypothetical protein